MPLPAATLRFPHGRVLLHRTRLAYVHLGNLLTDAKRDRAARVYGYVVVWLPEELLLFFLQEGEVVNATDSTDGRHFRPLSIADALAKVPGAAEFGEICFHECDDEQLATMYWSHVSEPLALPPEVDARDAPALFGFLRATIHDGVLEVRSDDGVNYGMVRDGRVVRAYLADPRDNGTTVDAALSTLVQSLRRDDQASGTRLWPVPPPLPVQAPPALIQAYRELMEAVVRRLVELGVDGAPAVAEQARQLLCDRHPVLERFALSHASPRGPVTETPALSAAMGAWLGDLLWAAAPADGTSPGQLIASLAHERRHVFQTAGLFESLPWKVEW